MLACAWIFASNTDVAMCVNDATSTNVDVCEYLPSTDVYPHYYSVFTSCSAAYPQYSHQAQSGWILIIHIEVNRNHSGISTLVHSVHTVYSLEDPTEYLCIHTVFTVCRRSVFLVRSNSHRIHNTFTVLSHRIHRAFTSCSYRGLTPCSHRA